MDVSLGAAINAAPSPDAACAPADTSAGASDGFAALLDEAAGSMGDMFDSSSPSAKDDAGEEDIFDEMAALVTPSLLSLNTPVAPQPEDGNEEFASEGDVTDNGSIADMAQSSLIDANARSQSIPAGDSDSGVAGQTTDGSLRAEWNANEQTAMTADAASEAAPVAEAADPSASDASGTVEAPRAESASTNRKSDAAPKLRRAGKSSHPAPAPAPQNLAARETSSAASGPADAETSAAGRTQPTEKPAPTSTAARLARALERAASLATGESNNSASLVGTSNTGNEQSSGFGDQLGERGRQSVSTARDVTGGLMFTVAGPNAIDMRTLSRAIDAVGHTAEVSPGSIPERDVVAQLVQSMRMQFRDGIGEAVVKLRPEHLGSVQISIKVENGALTATVQAEAPAVRQWLESQQDTLKTGLADYGLRLERFVVEPDGQQRQASDDAQEREHRRRQQQRRMSGKDHPVFEVTV